MPVYMCIVIHLNTCPYCFVVIVFSYKWFLISGVTRVSSTQCSAPLPFPLVTPLFLMAMR